MLVAFKYADYEDSEITFFDIDVPREDFDSFCKEQVTEIRNTGLNIHSAYEIVAQLLSWKYKRVAIDAFVVNDEMKFFTDQI